MACVLIADDNVQIVGILEKYLKADGYSVLTAYDGQAALDIFFSASVDLILLDVMMPKVDGFAVCRQIRQKSDVPILMVTARSEDFERIMGLDIGADDYIVKPFSPGEVLARVRAVLRRLEPRTSAGGVHLVQYDNLLIDLNKYVVAIDNQPVSLPKRAVEILYTLLNRPDQVFTREMLLDTLWGKDYYGDIRTVDSQMKRMRAVLNDYPHPNWDIKTIWGVGYKFDKHGQS
jgi:DNA-binding response OmpR family regulator